MRKNIVLIVTVCCCILAACKKETETLQITGISEYAPLKPGKYITYQLDSFRYLPFSTQGITISFQVKYLVDAEITDNSGRQAFRILRYIRKTAADAWEDDNTFTALETNNGYEFVENNLRFIKMKEPIRNAYSWKGNAYIDVQTSDPNAPDLRYLEDWDYVYDSVNAPLTLGSITLDSTVKVNQRDEVIGNPGDPNLYSEENFSVEYYAKRIGLVYKRFLHTEYQPPTSSNGNGYYSDASKGLTLTLIDHN